MGPWTRSTSAGGTSTLRACRSRRRPCRRPTGAQAGSRRGNRHEGHRARAALSGSRDRARQPFHGGPGQARLGGRGRRRVRPAPADPDARLQHRRRRRGGDLAGRQPVLRGAVRRGARPGGALPGADDAAVRDRGAAHRPVPRPVRARPALGDRRDHGGPRVPVLGARVLDRERFGARLRGRARRAGLVQGVRRHAGGRRTRLLPRNFTLVKANGRVSLSGIVGASVSAPIAALAALAGPEWSLRYATALFVVATVCAIRLPAEVDSSEGEGEMSWRGQEGSTSRRGRGAHASPARSRLRCAPTPARGSSGVSC